MFFTSPPAVLQTVLPWLLDLAQWGRFRFWNLQFQPKLHEKVVQKGNYSNSTTQLIFLENHHFKKKRQGPIRNLELRGETSQIFVGAIRMAWRLKPRRSGERREPVALESIPRSTTWTTWNPTAIPLIGRKKSSKSSKVPSMWKAVPSDNRQPIFPAGWDPAEMATSKGSIRSKSQSVIFCEALKHEFLSRIHSSSPKLWWTSSPFFDEVSTFGSRIYSYITWCSPGHTTSSGPSGPTPWMPATNLTNPWKWIEMVKWCEMLTLPNWYLSNASLHH